MEEPYKLPFVLGLYMVLDENGICLKATIFY